MKLKTLGINSQDFMVALKVWGNLLVKNSPSDKCKLFKLTGALNEAPVFSKSTLDIKSIPKYYYPVSLLSSNLNVYRYRLSDLCTNIYKYSIKDLSDNTDRGISKYRYSLNELRGINTYRYALEDFTELEKYRYKLSDLIEPVCYKYALSDLKSERSVVYNYSLSDLVPTKNVVYRYSLEDLVSCELVTYRYNLSDLIPKTPVSYKYLLEDLGVSQAEVDCNKSSTTTTDSSNTNSVTDNEVNTLKFDEVNSTDEDSEIVNLADLMDNSSSSEVKVSQDGTSDSSVSSITNSEVALEVPADIVDFLRKYPDHSSIAEVEKYYSKKDITLALRTGRILKRKNKYRI